MSPQMPHEVVWALSTSAVAARCLQVVADLGVADHLDDQVQPVNSLATACRVDSDALDRVLRLLAAHGIFERRPDGYRHTPASRLLSNEHPQSMRAFVSMMGLPFVWDSLTVLEHSVRTGSPGIETLEPQGAWSYLNAHPDQAAVFSRAMTAKAGADIAAVLSSYDFSRFTKIADVGGGRGHLLRAVLDTAPTAEGVLFDLPDVVAGFDLDRQRLTPIAGDFFCDPLPSADAYLLMEVLHDWDDASCVAILTAMRRAAPPDATVLVIEGVLTEDRADPRAQTVDIVMLSVTGGRERTPRGLGALFEQAGWQLGTVTDTPGPMRIVEARVGS